MSRRMFAVHRWLGAIVGLQLLAWSLGGLIFTTHPLKWVWGEKTRKSTTPKPLDLSKVTVGPAEAVTRSGAEGVTGVELVSLLGRPCYLVKSAAGGVLVDGSDGRLRSPLDEATALAIAKDDQLSGEVAQIERLEKDPPSEYRDQRLPAWRITFADGQGTRLYVHAMTGHIARRNDAWRRFDFFWMLHTMDYKGRDDFNHPLVIGFSALGVLSGLSGLVLWGLRIRRRLRRGPS